MVICQKYIYVCVVSTNAAPYYTSTSWLCMRAGVCYSKISSLIDFAFSLADKWNTQW